MLHALVGLLPRDAGEVLWNGSRVFDPSVFFVPPQAAFTPQIPRLFSDTLRENLVLGRNTEDPELRAAVHAAVLEHDVATFDCGLDTLVGARGVKLSGGQIQRTATARMFLRTPELLVIDDVSSALDAATEAELWRRLFQRPGDVTCLAVSHNPIAIGRADQVLVLEDGRLVESPSPPDASLR